MSNGQSPAPNPTDRAIVVGIDDYDQTYDDPIDSLNGCVNDAELFAEWLRRADGGGLKPEHVRMVVSARPRPAQITTPLKSNIEDEIVRLIKVHQNTGQRVGRRLYLWFSGHGITPSQDELECAVLVANARKVSLRSFPGRLAARNICHRGSMFQEVVLFMDCCRSVTGLQSATVDYPLDGSIVDAAQVKYLQAFATQTSTTSRGRMLPDPRDPSQTLLHGVFTHALLEGLRYGANANGRIDSESLERYVKKRAQDLLPPEDNQRPDFKYEKQQLIDFGPGKQTTVTVTLQNPGAGFQVLDGSDLTVVHSTPALAANPAQLGLSPRRYLFASPGTGENFVVSRIVTVMGDPIHVNL